MTVDLTSIKAIFFDIDGTLSDSDDQIIAEVYRRIRFLSVFWKEESLKTFSRSLISTSMTVFNALYHVVDRLGIDNMIANVFPRKSGKDRKDLEEDDILIDGVSDMLEKLYGRFKLGIVTARGARGVEKFIKQFSYEKYFDVIVSARTCYYTKPYPHPVRYACEQVGEAPQDCVMVGDTIVDIVSGKAAGVKTVGVLCGFGTEQELKKNGADIILSSPPDLVTLLG